MARDAALGGIGQMSFAVTQCPGDIQQAEGRDAGEWRDCELEKPMRDF